MFSNLFKYLLRPLSDDSNFHHDDEGKAERKRNSCGWISLHAYRCYRATVNAMLYQMNMMAQIWQKWQMEMEFKSPFHAAHSSYNKFVIFMSET